MIRRIALGIAWLALCALVGPSVLVAGDAVPQVELSLPGVVPAQPAPAPPAAPAAAAPETPPVAAPAPAPAQPPAEPAAVEADAPAEKKPLARKAASGSVSIKDFKFAPASITVNVGDTVTWTNSDTAPHNAVANDGSFKTSDLKKGGSGSATISAAGTHAYICTIHPSMKGTVVAVAADSGGGSDDPAADADDGGGSAQAGADDGDTTANGTELPNTGSDAGLIAIAGLGLLLIGLGGRRRTPRAGAL